jgi:nucleolar protein 14
MPYVFEVPTTLEALHEMIGNFASTGREASLIVERIHASNSVRLSRKNEEKMQNFYDVVLRRFIAVGDAVYTSGRGGDELDRYEQLDSLTRTLYAMSQDAPETTAAVWGRRLGVLQNAHAKRLRDSEFVQEEERADDDEITAWPSTGTLFLLRALGHIFPATDRRHQVMTPAMLLIGQMVAQTPVLSVHDLVMGLFCTGLLIEYSREAKRVVPEALAFLCGVIRLFSNTTDDSPIPTMKQVDSNSIIAAVKDYTGEVCPKLSPEKEAIIDLRVPVAILCSALQLIDAYADALGGSLNFAESEAFSEIIKALLSLSRTKQAIPKIITTRVTATASKLSQLVKNAARPPLARRAAPKVESAVPSLAPRLQDPDRFKSLSTSNKTMEARREWKREKKAVARELRLDASMVEQERRHTQDSIQNKVRAKRLKNFAWLEGEQAAMNNQVRQGGGLLSGGGMGAARAKASTGKLGIKKGGKF